MDVVDQVHNMNSRDFFGNHHSRILLRIYFRMSKLFAVAANKVSDPSTWGTLSERFVHIFANLFWRKGRTTPKVRPDLFYNLNFFVGCEQSWMPDACLIIIDSLSLNAVDNVTADLEIDSIWAGIDFAWSSPWMIEAGVKTCTLRDGIGNSDRLQQTDRASDGEASDFGGSGWHPMGAIGEREGCVSPFRKSGRDICNPIGFTALQVCTSLRAYV
jgi:hypothetical protein